MLTSVVLGEEGPDQGNQKLIQGEVHSTYSPSNLAKQVWRVFQA